MRLDSSVGRARSRPHGHYSGKYRMSLEEEDRTLNRFMKIAELPLFSDYTQQLLVIAQTHEDLVDAILLERAHAIAKCLIAE